MRQTIFKKLYIVYTLLIPFSLTIALVPISNTSALSYQSDVGINFTFNPTLSISLSPNNLTIPNLSPSTTDTSNEISVNVSTNNVYGYSLYATVGNSTYDNTNLTRSGSNDVFASISANADLSSLTADNTWGYTYSLDNGTTWSNYNGLPLYTTDNPTRLKKNTGPSEDVVNFKIAAKSSTTQPSGTYTNVINFTAITKPTPVTLADAYASEGKELYHGYYKMQDMTHTICEETEDIGAQLQVIDIRDDKVYWISKLADNNCWMTQNLDYNINSEKPLNSETSDLVVYNEGIYTAESGYSKDISGVIIWTPKSGNNDYSTINATGGSISGWVADNSVPYSIDLGDWYQNGIYFNSKTYNFLSNPSSCTDYFSRTPYATNNTHGHIGNYYNWSAAVASNNSYHNGSQQHNSICPANWELPNYSNYSYLNSLYNYNNIGSGSLFDQGLLRLPLYFVRSGYIRNNALNGAGSSGTYTTNSGGASSARYMTFSSSTIKTDNSLDKHSGRSIRCLAR